MLRGGYGGAAEVGAGGRGRCSPHSTENSEEPEAAPQVPRLQRLKPTSWERPQSAPRAPPEQHRLASRRARSRRLAAQRLPGCPRHIRDPIQVAEFQALTRPASDRPSPATALPLVRCRPEIRNPNEDRDPKSEPRLASAGCRRARARGASGFASDFLRISAFVFRIWGPGARWY